MVEAAASGGGRTHSDAAEAVLTNLDYGERGRENHSDEKPAEEDDVEEEEKDEERARLSGRMIASCRFYRGFSPKYA